MFNGFNKHTTKPKTVFLDVKPSFVNPTVRRFSGLQTRKDSIALYGTDTRPSLSSVTSLENFQKVNKTLCWDVLFSNIGASYLFMRCLGAMPVTRRSPGNALFSMASIAFAYSVLVFVILIIYVGYVADSRIQIVSSLKGPFEEAVIAYLFLVNILPILLIPIIWSETRKVAALMNDWNDFEILYFQISGHSVPLKIRRKAMGITIALPLLSILSVVITHITMADFHILQVIPYCILDNLTAMLGAWWYLSCKALSDTANILAERFQKALRHIGPAAMVADYRSLWLRLSKLTRDTGTATCYTFTFLNLYLFFIITLSIYGLMSQLSEGFGIKDIGLAITAVWSICLLFFICDEAHYASHNVRTNFQKKLLMVELSWMNFDAQTEINMFLRATEMNPSNINCGGFFDVNRNLFKGLLTTMVTYLVVLLQFQISIPDGKPRGNFTFGVGSLLNGTDVVVSLISH